MIYRKKTYKIHPQKLDAFNDFFHTYLYPNQIKHGATLIGRWVNESKDEIIAIWQYTSMEQYENIESKIRNSDLHQKAQERRMELGDLYIESRQKFLETTAPYPATYHPPQHIVAVSGYITNEKDEVLLVRNLHRSDTLEMPGGQVEEGESLVEAINREVLEETGISVSLIGVTGIYQNISSGIICVVFRGKYKSGVLQPAEGETSEVIFKQLSFENVAELIARPHFRSRVLDAMKPSYLPYEIFKVRPHELVQRYEPKTERH